MSDDDKSMNDRLICNQCLATYNKLRSMNPIGLSSPWAESLQIIALHPVKNQGINPMVLSVPWADSFEIISLRPVRKIAVDDPNGT